MKLFNRTLFNPATFNAGPPIKLFNKAQFRNPTFNTGEQALRLFNKVLFKTQPFNTGEPIVVEIPPVSGGGDSSLARHKERGLSREHILSTNNLLLMCAGAFIQTIAPDSEIIHGQGDI